MWCLPGFPTKFGATAQRQSYTQDASNFYITFLVHFSTDTVEIDFASYSVTSSTSSTSGTSSTGGTSASSTSQASNTSSSSGGGGIPEFPFQAFVVGGLVLVIAVSYLAVRRNRR